MNFAVLAIIVMDICNFGHLIQRVSVMFRLVQPGFTRNDLAPSQTPF